MQKFFAMVLALIMSLLGLTPAVQPADAYTQAEWYALVADEFNLTYDVDDGDNYGIGADDPNYQVVEACYDWNILVGEFDAGAAVTNYIVAKSLAVAAGIGGAKAPDDAALQVAIDAGIVSVRVTLFGKIKEVAMSKVDANTALAAAKKAYLDKLANAKRDNGGTITTTENDVVDMGSLSLIGNGDALNLQSADGSIIGEDDIAYLNYQGSVNPFVQPEIAGINQQSILDKINVSFDVGPISVSAAVKDTGFDVSLGGNIKGVNLTKQYEVRNFNISTKFDGDLAKAQINEAYAVMDYDVTDRTIIDGSYAKTIVDKAIADNELVGADDVDFFSKVQNGMNAARTTYTNISDKLPDKVADFVADKIPDSIIELFSVDVAIPNCPAITIGFTVKLVFTFDGRVELVVTSTEQKGIYISDNKVRTVSEETANDSTLIADARAEAILTLGVNVKFVKIVVIDADVQVGIGVRVTATVSGGAATYNMDIPVDFLFDVNLSYPNCENISVVARVKVYGIVKISIGQNSPILSKLGLKKTWTLVDESNGTFLDETYDIVNPAA